jgi:hypothetical protein
LQRIRLGEDSTLELKHVKVRAGGKSFEPHADGLSDELAAFANASGGTLILGVDDKTKEVSGIQVEQLDAVESWLTAICSDRIRPPLDLVTRHLELPGPDGRPRPVIVVEVPRSLCAMAEAFDRLGVSYGSHDDPDGETREFYTMIGARIAEFPLSKRAASAAHAMMCPVIMGAPNVVRGGSQAGNVAAEELIVAGQCDALVSDYHIPALALAAWTLVERGLLDLPRAWALISEKPAEILRLPDRGRLTPGLRASIELLKETCQGLHVPDALQKLEPAEYGDVVIFTVVVVVALIAIRFAFVFARSEGARIVKKGSAHGRGLHGNGTSNIRLIHLRP